MSLNDNADNPCPVLNEEQAIKQINMDAVRKSSAAADADAAAAAEIMLQASHFQTLILHIDNVDRATHD
jgi:hypothetical protein